MFFHLFNSFIKFGAHKHPIDKIAEINGLLSGIALYPQVFKVIITKSVSGLSVYTFLFIFINSIIWIIYARHRFLPQVLISSLFNFFAAGILLCLMIVFSKN